MFSNQGILKWSMAASPVKIPSRQGLHFIVILFHLLAMLVLSVGHDRPPVTSGQSAPQPWIGPSTIPQFNADRPRHPVGFADGVPLRLKIPVVSIDLPLYSPPLKLDEAATPRFHDDDAGQVKYQVKYDDAGPFKYTGQLQWQPTQLDVKIQQELSAGSFTVTPISVPFIPLRLKSDNDLNGKPR